MTDLIARCDAARDFPRNTCGASRVAYEMGYTLKVMGNLPATMILADSREEAGDCILATVAALWETRTALREARNLPGKW